jgi:glycosyltransferase involved in cell wall biosynthesis
MIEYMTRDQMLLIPAEESGDRPTDSSRPLVSVIMMAYNHEEYIGEAINGVIMQQCPFDIELLLGEDASTDRTRELCIDYQRRFPKTIRLIVSDRNVGMHRNFFRLFCRARGRYIALCEGDDYWTSNCKLAQQIAFMMANPECSFTFHNANILNGKRLSRRRFINRELRNVTLSTIIEKDWFIPTASMVCDSGKMGPYPAAMLDYPSGDLALQVFLAAKGTVKYLPNVMSVYRRTTSNMTHELSSTPDKTLSYGAAFIAMLRSLDAALSYAYSRSFSIRIRRTMRSIDYISFRYKRKMSPEILRSVVRHLFEGVLKLNKVA